MLPSPTSWLVWLAVLLVVAPLILTAIRTGYFVVWVVVEEVGGTPPVWYTRLYPYMDPEFGGFQ